MTQPIEQHGTTLQRAIELAEDCRRIHKLLGAQASYPYRQDQIVKALLTLADNHDPTAVTQDELTLWKRKWTAVNAQLAKYKKHAGREIEDDEGSAAAVVEDA